jgi:DMSO/TMAO reductase YedYZ molybdopterin-dependent catalytic subunit
VPGSARLYDALAGVIAAGTGLAATELAGAVVSSGRPTPIGSVAGRAVDVGAGSLKDLAIRLFGTNDKAALVVGIVIVSMLVGAGVGLVAARYRWAGPVVFGAAAVIGILAARADPLASVAVAIVACGFGAVAATAAHWLLLRLRPMPATAATAATAPARAPGGPVPARAPLPDPRVKTADRRTFFAVAGGVSLAAGLGALASRSLRGTSPTTATRDATVLPPPVATVPVPASQPFAVDGLTPYVTPNDAFYRIDTAIFLPQVDVKTWRLSISGMVDRPVSFSYGDLLAMELVEEPVTMACVSNDVGGNLVGNAVWRGVPLTRLLDMAGVHPDASQIIARSADDFTVGLPTDKATDGRTALVAIGMNGEPLPVVHGYPARLVVAGLYGYVSATKWVTALELTRLDDADSFWVERGWAKQGPIKLASRVDVPRSGARLPAGPVTLAGVAWAPSIGISAVEVQVDDGAWQKAGLGAIASSDTWVQWRLQVDLAPGSHVAAVRAHDSTGAVQTDEPQPPEPDGATGYHYRAFTTI